MLRPLGIAEPPHRLQIWSDYLVAFEAELGTVEGATNRADRLAGDPLALPTRISTELAELLVAVEAEPDPSATAQARGFLIIAQERWTRVRLARADHAKAAAAQTTASTVYRNYCNAVARLVGVLVEYPHRQGRQRLKAGWKVTTRQRRGRVLAAHVRGLQVLGCGWYSYTTSTSREERSHLLHSPLPEQPRAGWSSV